MLIDEFIYQIRQELRHVPTAGQQQVIGLFAQFMFCRDPQAVMILRGSAGTGKTTLAGAMVRTLARLKQKVMLLAPTGRAAKVFSLHAGSPAFTIHRKIYLQRSFDGSGGAFNLSYNKQHDTLFIIDEASMIANDDRGMTAFGSGRLLDDLISFVYGGQRCRMVLIGDKAQLPPVGAETSPALSGSQLAMRGLEVFECDLDEVLRQSHESGILWNATMIRQLVAERRTTGCPKIRLKGFADITVVPGDELIERLASSFSHVGTDETMVVTRSNKRANIYNQGIRNMILGREEEFTTGDLLMVVKNNYYWTEQHKEAPMAFIANGDIAVVQRVRNIRRLYGFRFADVGLRFPDYDDYELTVTVLLDTLRSESPALTREQQEQLFDAVMDDYADVPQKQERIGKLKKDAHFNALQVKYAYAVTCHKAQGGQWAHVYVDQGYMTDDMLSEDYFHWLYTAFTRATEQLYLVNWPKDMLETTT